MGKKLFRVPGKERATSCTQIFMGRNQTNTKPIETIAAYTGLYTRIGMSEEVIYKMTKSFWEHIDEMYSVTSWAKGALNKKNIFAQNSTKLHPGALKYYKEIGIKIPANAM